MAFQKEGKCQGVRRGRDAVGEYVEGQNQQGMQKSQSDGHISGKDRNSNSKRHLHLNVHSSAAYQDRDAT